MEQGYQQQPQQQPTSQLDFTKIINQLDNSASIDPVSSSLLKSITDDFFHQILHEACNVAKQTNKVTIDNEVMSQVSMIMKPSYFSHQLRSVKNVQKPPPSPAHRQRMELIRNFQQSKAAAEDQE